MHFLRAARPVAILIALLIGATAAHAVEVVSVRPDAAAIDLTAVVEAKFGKITDPLPFHPSS